MSAAPREIRDPDIPVLAAVIERAGRFLVCQRPRHKRHGGLWEFPGGKLEPGESLLAAAERELAEELGMRVTGIGDVLFEQHDAGSPFLIRFVHVECSGEPQPLEHEDIRWVERTGLLELPLAPSDRAFAEWLVEQRR